MAFIDAPTLRSLVADDLQKSDPADLGAPDGSFAAAVSSAEQEIRGVLLDRGYSAATILAWDRLEAYHGFIARYELCSLVMSIARAYPTDQIDIFAARRKELATVRVFVNGELVNPDRGAREDAGGSVGYGRMGGVTEAERCCRDGYHHRHDGW